MGRGTFQKQVQTIRQNVYKIDNERYYVIYNVVIIDKDNHTHTPPVFKTITFNVNDLEKLLLTKYDKTEKDILKTISKLHNEGNLNDTVVLTQSAEIGNELQFQIEEF